MERVLFIHFKNSFIHQTHIEYLSPWSLVTVHVYIFEELLPPNSEITLHLEFSTQVMKHELFSGVLFSFLLENMFSDSVPNGHSRALPEAHTWRGCVSGALEQEGSAARCLALPCFPGGRIRPWAGVLACLTALAGVIQSALPWCEALD